MATKVIKIKADTMDEAMEEIVKSIKEELEANEEDQDCKNCENKKECELKEFEFHCKDLLNAMYAVLRASVKEEHRAQLDKDYEKFLKNEGAWMFASFLEDYVEEMNHKFLTALKEEDVQKGIMEVCNAKVKELKKGK